MDYQQLHALLPKSPHRWSVEDVSAWLTFIGLDGLGDPFKSHSIDGSCILGLTEEDLRSELQVKSNIIVKKLMIWIKTGLAEFQQYLAHQGHVESFKPHGQSQDRGRPLTNHEKHAQTLEKKEPSEIQKLNLNNFQLQLEQLNTAHRNNFYVPREGAKIGRSNVNDIILTEVDVSRNHAEIISNGSTFQIRDRGSISGTFIQILQPLEIKTGTLIEIGSHMLEIGEITPNRVNLTITSQNNSVMRMDKKFNESGSISIGRKSPNDITIQDDAHLSNSHAAIYYHEGKCYYRDLNTTNGSWLRLSAASQISAPYQLKDQCIIKIGINIVYLCKLSFREDTEGATENSCAVCFSNPKDCVTLPCNHNSICIKCCKTLKQCPICRVRIENFLRIYHK